MFLFQTNLNQIQGQAHEMYKIEAVVLAISNRFEIGFFLVYRNDRIQGVNQTSVHKGNVHIVFFLFYNTQNVSKACLLCAHCVLTSIGGVRQLDPRNYRTGRSTEQIWWNLQQGCPKKVHTKTNQRNPQKTTQIKKSICLFAIWPVNSHSHSHQ